MGHRLFFRLCAGARASAWATCGCSDGGRVSRMARRVLHAFLRFGPRLYWRNAFAFTEAARLSPVARRSRDRREETDLCSEIRSSIRAFFCPRRGRVRALSAATEALVPWPLRCRGGDFITLEGVEGFRKRPGRDAGRRTAQEGRRVRVTHDPVGPTRGKQYAQSSSIPRSRSTSQRNCRWSLPIARTCARKTSAGAETGEIVISDRYSDSTAAYQGYGRGVDLSVARQLERARHRNVTPDLTIVLDLKVEPGLARTRARAKDKGSDSIALKANAWISIAGARGFSRDREG